MSHRRRRATGNSSIESFASAPRRASRRLRPPCAPSNMRQKNFVGGREVGPCAAFAKETCGQNSSVGPLFARERSHSTATIAGSRSALKLVFENPING